MKRLFDLIMSILGLVVLSPFLILISLWVIIDAGFPVFYRQSRVGKNNKDFKLIKFRSMRPDSDKKGLITVGGRDPRVTTSGYYLRKYKLDELPQLFNILGGSMSFVGPRPEVRHYVEMYNDEQMKVLSVRPGLTDYASLEYFDENAVLEKSSDPEKTYIEEVMPDKLNLNMKYIGDSGFVTDLKIIFRTFRKII